MVRKRRNYELLANQLGIQGRVVFTGNQVDPLPFYQHVFDVNVLRVRSDAFRSPFWRRRLRSCRTSPPLCDRDSRGCHGPGDREPLHRRGPPDACCEELFSLLPSPGLRERSVRPAAAGSKGVFNEHYCQSIERSILGRPLRALSTWAGSPPN